jgi:hypothetical protein
VRDAEENRIWVGSQFGLSSLVAGWMLVDMRPIYIQDTHCRLLLHILRQNEILFFLRSSFVKFRPPWTSDAVFPIPSNRPPKKWSGWFKIRAQYWTKTCLQLDLRFSQRWLRGVGNTLWSGMSLLTSRRMFHIHPHQDSYVLPASCWLLTFAPSTTLNTEM